MRLNYSDVRFLDLGERVIGQVFIVGIGMIRLVSGESRFELVSSGTSLYQSFGNLDEEPFLPHIKGGVDPRKHILSQEHRVMRSIASIVTLLALSPSLIIADDEPSSQVSLPSNQTHPLTFREALHAANERKVEGNEGHEALPTVQPHLLDQKNKHMVEIVRINERMTVDEKNKPKAYSARVHTALYAIESGRLRRLFHADMLVKPKAGSSLLNRIQASRFAADTPANGEKPSKLQEWFMKLADKFHLESFWPRLFVSILLGFIATLIIFALCYATQLIFLAITGYRPLGNESEHSYVIGNDSADGLIRSEQKRMAEVQPLK